MAAGVFRPTTYTWLQAEFDLTGDVLLNGDYVIPLIRKIVTAADFYDDMARAVFIAACQLDNQHTKMDPVLIQNRAEQNGVDLPTEKLAEIMKTHVTPASCEETARIIHNGAIERASRDIGMMLADKRIDANDAAMQLMNLTQGIKSRLSDPMSDMNEFVDTLNALQTGEKKLFLKTGYPKLDQQLAGGLIHSGMITVAARPGIGKTTMALNLADKVAASGAKVLYESLEMSKFQLLCRRTARLSGIGFQALQNGKLQDSDWSKVMDTADKLVKRNFIIQDKPTKIEDIARRAIAEKPDLLVIDHIGLVKMDHASHVRYQDMTEISHRIKSLAMTIERPVLALCQLNRMSEQRSDKRPGMADLRDTGAIEEDSDVVMLLHRPARYLPREEQPGPWDTQDFEVNVEKNRHGATGIVDMKFVGATALIRESDAWKRGDS